MSIETRFWSKVRKLPDGGCWIWTAALRSGYGRFSINNRMVQAHRVAYALEIGPIPSDLTLDHLCRNTACVNPEHLEPTTMRENIQRANALRPAPRGPRVPVCPYGHPKSGENLTVHANGQYICKQCQRERGARRNHAQRAVEAAASPCGHVSKWGRSCGRPVGHSGRHYSATPLASQIRSSLEGAA